MAENSKITWTHHTFNPWMGCTKVSPACANCYAERDMDHRWKRVLWGPQGTRVLTSESNWNQPVKHLFLSCEPLLGPIELSVHSGIDWVITGSESGPNKRDVPDSYYESLAKQCSDSVIPFFMKQINRDGVTIHDMSMFPESLGFQQFPT